MGILNPQMQQTQRPPGPPMGQQRPPGPRMGQQRPPGPPMGQQRPPMQRPPGQQMQRPPGQPMQNGQQPTGQQGKEEFDELIIEAINILHTPETADAMVKLVRTAKSKVEEIGKMAVRVLVGIEVKSKKTGVDINAKTAIHGLNIIVGEIITLAEASGMEKATDEQKYQAFSFALSRYLKKAFKDGKYTKEELIKAAQEMSQRKSGQAIIKKLGPGAMKLAQGGPGQQPPAGQAPEGQAPPMQRPPMGQQQMQSPPMGQQPPQGQQMQRPPGQPMQRPPMQQGILGQRRM